MPCFFSCLESGTCKWFTGSGNKELSNQTHLTIAFVLSSFRISRSAPTSKNFLRFKLKNLIFPVVNSTIFFKKRWEFIIKKLFLYLPLRDKKNKKLCSVFIKLFGVPHDKPSLHRIPSKRTTIDRDTRFLGKFQLRNGPWRTTKHAMNCHLSLFFLGCCPFIV